MQLDAKMVKRKIQKTTKNYKPNDIYYSDSDATYFSDDDKLYELQVGIKSCEKESILVTGGTVSVKSNTDVKVRLDGTPHYGSHDELLILNNSNIELYDILENYNNNMFDLNDIIQFRYNWGKM